MLSVRNYLFILFAFLLLSCGAPKSFVKTGDGSWTSVPIRSEIEKDKVEKSVDLSITKYCGVMEMFRNFSKITNLIDAVINNGSKDYDLDYIRNHVEKLTS